MPTWLTTVCTPPVVPLTRFFQADNHVTTEAADMYDLVSAFSNVTAQCPHRETGQWTLNDWCVNVTALPLFSPLRWSDGGNCFFINNSIQYLQNKAPVRSEMYSDYFWCGFLDFSQDSVDVLTNTWWRYVLACRRLQTWTKIKRSCWFRPERFTKCNSNK